MRRVILRSMLLMLLGCMTYATSARALVPVARQAPIPVEEGAAAVQRWIDKHPDQVIGYQELAVLHAAAYNLRAAKLPMARMPDGTPSAPPVAMTGPYLGIEEGSLPREKAVEHLRLAIAASTRSFNLARPHDQLMRHARMLEKAQAEAQTLGPTTMPATPVASAAQTRPSEADLSHVRKLIAQLSDNEYAVRQSAQSELQRNVFEALPILRAHAADADLETRTAVEYLLSTTWSEAAALFYLEAYRATIKVDSSLTRTPLEERKNFTSYQAGEAYLRIITGRGVRADERDNVAEVEAGMKKLRTR